MKHIRERWCDLLQENGEIADADTDKKMDFHFNALLDAIAERRSDKTLLPDVSLEGSEWQPALTHPIFSRLHYRGTILHKQLVKE